MNISRKHDQQQVSFTSAPLSGIVGLTGFCGGGYIIAGTWAGSAELAFKVSADGISWYQLEDEFGNRIEHVVAASPSGARILPPELFGFSYLKLWSQNAGVDQNQTISVIVCLQG